MGTERGQAPCPIFIVPTSLYPIFLRRGGISRQKKEENRRGRKASEWNELYTIRCSFRVAQGINRDLHIGCVARRKLCGEKKKKRGKPPSNADVLHHLASFFEEIRICNQKFTEKEGGFKRGKGKDRDLVGQITDIC